MNHHTAWQTIVSQSTAVLSCIATCHWQRALFHLHCDVTIGTSAIKIRCSCLSFMRDSPCLRKKIGHKKKQINVLNICQSNEEDLKITSRQDYSHLVPWISFKCSSSLNCTSNWILRGFLWSIYPYLLGRLQAIADIPLNLQFSSKIDRYQGVGGCGGGGGGGWGGGGGGVVLPV